MRTGKLLIAAALAAGLSFTSLTARAADAGGENRIVAASQLPHSVAEMALANFNAASGAVSSIEDLAALRLSPAVANSPPFSQPVTLPQASPVPEPGALVFGLVAIAFLRRRR